MHAVLVGHDSGKFGLWTMTVGAKGPTPAAVKWLSDTIDDAG